jgi:hypothetical protein
MVILLIISVIVNIILVILYVNKNPVSKTEVEIPIPIKKKPVAISNQNVLYWRSTINNCEDGELPAITDDFGNRYVIFGVSPKGITVFESGPNGWTESSKTQFNFNEVVAKFSSVFNFDYDTTEKIVQLKESEYKRLKEIEALHAKGLEEINELFDPETLKQLA